MSDDRSYDPHPLDMTNVMQLVSTSTETAAVHGNDHEWTPSVMVTFVYQDPEWNEHSIKLMIRVTDITSLTTFLVESAQRSLEDFATTPPKNCDHDGH